MGRRLRLVAALLGAAVAALAGSPAQPYTYDCMKSDSSPEVTIAGCTVAIDRIPYDRSRSAVEKANAYGRRAAAHAKKGDLDTALADYDEAIRQHPRYAYMYFERGGVHQTKGDLAMARADYEAALRLNPKLSEAKDALARVRRALATGEPVTAELPKPLPSPGSHDCGKEDPDISIRGCTADLALTTPKAIRNRSDTYFYRGLAYDTRRDYARALADYEEAIRLRPKAPFAHTARGLVFEHQGNLARARDDYEAALVIRPDYDTARTALARVRSKLASPEPVSSDRPSLAAAPVVADQPRPEALTPASVTDVLSRGQTGALGAIDAVVAILGSRFGGQGELTEPNSTMTSVPVVADGPKPNAVVTAPPKPAEAPPATVAAPLSPADTAAAVVAPTIVANLEPGGSPLARPISSPDNRVALVIGNASYRAVAKLTNPPRDAAAVAEALRRVGFRTVQVSGDLTRGGMIQALRAFEREAEKADWAVVYFAGHGIEVGGVNYLVPVDAVLNADRDVPDEAVPLERVLSSIENAKKLKLVILDACRNNPFIPGMKRSIASRSVGRGLAQVEPEGGVLVAYAAKHGQVAEDGEGGNSPFVAALTKRLDTPGLDISLLFRFVRDDVLAATGRRQEPFVYGSLPGEVLSFRPASGP